MQNREQQSSKSHWTHIEDVKNLVEFQLPSSNLVLIALRVENSRNMAAPPLFDGFPLNIRDGPDKVRFIVSKPAKLRTTGSTYIVNWFIASHTDGLRSFSRFPPIPLSSALQILAQSSPSST